MPYTFIKRAPDTIYPKPLAGPENLIFNIPGEYAPVPYWRRWFGPSPRWIAPFRKNKPAYGPTSEYISNKREWNNCFIKFL